VVPAGRDAVAIEEGTRAIRQSGIQFDRMLPKIAMEIEVSPAGFTE